MPNNKVTPITDEKVLEGLELQGNVFADLEYKTLGYKLELLSDQKIEGKQCYRVKVISPKGYKTIKWYDKQSGLLVKALFEDGSQSYYSVYRDIEGITASTQEKIVSALGAIANFKIISVSLNVKIDQCRVQLINAKVIFFSIQKG